MSTRDQSIVIACRQHPLVRTGNTVIVLHACCVSSLLVGAAALRAAVLVQDVAPAVPPTMATSATVEPSGAFGDVIMRLQEQSPTFCRQLRRLGSSRVRVRVWADYPQRTASVLARTIVKRHEGEITSADIYLPISPYTVELLAHEVEHVVEQLDGVDLAAHLGTGQVWRGRDGGFETRRAVDVGRRVAAEAGAPMAPLAARR